jgi:membrane-bound lytic murein transglycosylase D
MVKRNVHLEQVAEVLGLNIDLLRSLNPQYRRDVVPGATEPSALRLPLTESGRFIDLEDSVYNYRADELLTKRIEVEVKDDVPTYYHKSKRYARGKKGRATKRTKATRKRSTKATKKRATTKKRTAAPKKRKAKSKKRR